MENNSEMDVKGKGAGAERDAAEKKLTNSPGFPSGLKTKSPEEIIRDLQVHQIKLEMQNEELRRIHLALEESRDKYQDLYDFAPVGYFTLNHKGIIKDVNLTGGTALLGNKNDISKSMILFKQPFKHRRETANKTQNGKNNSTSRKPSILLITAKWAFYKDLSS